MRRACILMAKPGNNAARCRGGQSGAAAYNVIEDGTMGKWHDASGETWLRGERRQESESQ